MASHDSAKPMRKETRAEGAREEIVPVSSRARGPPLAPLHPTPSTSTHPDGTPGFLGASRSHSDPQTTPSSESSSSRWTPTGPASYAPPDNPAPPRGKVAIPPLRARQPSESSSQLRKGRTAHACDACRKAKAGCDGGQPCSRCKNSRAECIYGDGKRDRDRKQFSKLSKDTDRLAQTNSKMVHVLQHINKDTSLSLADVRLQIRRILTMPSARESLEQRELPISTAKATAEHDSSEDEDDNDEDVGSNASMDVTVLDPDRDYARATGHMGKASLVSMTRRTAQAAGSSGDEEAGEGISIASYHTEEGDIEPIDMHTVDGYEWPKPRAAANLVHAYFEHIHEALPLVNKADFLARFAVVNTSGNVSLEDKKWLATANMVLAISAVHAQLTRRLEVSDPRDHFVYHARAVQLFQPADMLYHDARISDTCILGLMCLYFISIDYVNRAWAFSGVALRQAFSQALHHRNVSKNLVDAEKEYRVRLWWSLFALECTLNELTGRPSGVADRDISTALPMDMDEEAMSEHRSIYDPPMDGTQHRTPSMRDQSFDSTGRPATTYSYGDGGAQPLDYTFPNVTPPITTSTYFIYRTQLAVLSHKIVTQLYCASTVRDQWHEVQTYIKQLGERLKSWKTSIPPAFSVDFEPYSIPDWDDPQTLKRMGLAMVFNSSQMMICRPALCRFEDRKKRPQSSQSKDQDHASIMTCISSARNIITLLTLAIKNPKSHSPSPSARFHAIPPFWLTLHYLCQALAVLMLEMAFRAQHVSVNEAAEILEDAKSGVRWLNEMSTSSISARKAWEIFDQLIRLVAPMIRWSVFDLPTKAPVPPGYKSQRARGSASASATAAHADPSQPQAQSPTQMPGFAFQPPMSYLYTDPYNPANAMDPMLSTANPLDQTTAVEGFSTIGSIYGHFDDPWMDMFLASSGNATGDTDIMMGGAMHIDGPDGETGGGGIGGSASAAMIYETGFPDLEGYGQYGAGFAQPRGFGEG